MGMRMLSGKLNDAQSRINWVMIGAGILWVSIPDIGCTWKTVLISSGKILSLTSLIALQDTKICSVVLVSVLQSLHREHAGLVGV